MRREHAQHLGASTGVLGKDREVPIAVLLHERLQRFAPAAFHDLLHLHAQLAHRDAALAAALFERRIAFDLVPGAKRSEEHTSELQSRSDLVCRLLLEKKKK